MLTLLLTTWLWVTPILHESSPCVYYAEIKTDKENFWIGEKADGTPGLCIQDWYTLDDGYVSIVTPLYTIIFRLDSPDLGDGWVYYSAGQPTAEWHPDNGKVQRIHVHIFLKEEI